MSGSFFDQTDVVPKIILPDIMCDLQIQPK